MLYTSPFLQAEWRNLVMANYRIDPAVLKNHIPCHTELDDYNGVYYASLVGFLFKNTKVRGISFPFHRTFEEVNLRFYVRYKENNEWKRGVVFMKEIVPRRMITFVANTLYKEKYATHAMKHKWEPDENMLRVSYQWKVNGNWDHISVLADKDPVPIISGSEEEFITEHYWGYTFISDTCTGVYEVKHPKWNIHHVRSYDINCSIATLYGNEFVPYLSQKPVSVFLAEGSPIRVMKGSKVFIR